MHLSVSWQVRKTRSQGSKHNVKLYYKNKDNPVERNSFMKKITLNPEDDEGNNVEVESQGGGWGSAD